MGVGGKGGRRWEGDVGVERGVGVGRGIGGGWGWQGRSGVDRGEKGGKWGSGVAGGCKGGEKKIFLVSFLLFLGSGLVRGQ